MKKIFLFILTILLVSNAFAFSIMVETDTIKNPTVPKEILTSFSKAHPNAKLAYWTKSNNIYIVSYREQSSNLWTTYDSNGQFLENKWKVVLAELPIPTQDYIKRNSTKAVQEYYKITDSSGVINYEVSSPNKSCVFNSNGEHYKTIELLKK
jgi:hypothetical protein